MNGLIFDVVYCSSVVCIDACLSVGRPSVHQCIQCESKKILSMVFWHFFPNGREFLINFYIHITVPFYTRLQIFIQLFPSLTKLCHTKRDHLSNFCISLEI